MRWIPKKALSLLGMAAWAAWPLAAQTPAAPPAASGLPERAQWESAHRAAQAAAFTEAACGAPFPAQLQDARNAAQAYLRAVAAGAAFWARQQEEALGPPPEPAPIGPAIELLEAEAAEAERLLKELAPVKSLDAPAESLKAAQERSRFEWRSLPEPAAAAQSALAELAARHSAVRAALKAQQGPPRAEMQRLQTAYDLLEAERNRRCARSLDPAPAAAAPSDDPFAVPRAPAPRPPSTRKK